MLTGNVALDKYMARYIRDGGRALTDIRRRVDKHLRPFFGARDASALTTRDLEGYAETRWRGGVSDQTIRAELAILRRALKLSYLPAPPLPYLKPSKPRRGYVSIPEFCRLRAAMPRHLRGLVTFTYITGWRFRSESQRLLKEHVDLAGGMVHLPPELSKNAEGRKFPLDLTIAGVGSLRQVVTEAMATDGPWLFARRHGGRICDWRGSLLYACARTLLSVRPHDWRRSAVTNMHRAGLSMHLAMQLVGHRTVQTHLEYIQSDDSDLRAAVAQLEAFYQQPSEPIRRPPPGRPGERALPRRPTDSGQRLSR